MPADDDREEIHLRNESGGLLCGREIGGGMVLFESVEQVTAAGFGPLEVCEQCRAMLAASLVSRN
jgi:hypothetical protein